MTVHNQASLYLLDISGFHMATCSNLQDAEQAKERIESFTGQPVRIRKGN